MDILRLLAERKIQEAIEEGKFDNLPGKGEPIVFDDDPMTPSHLRMANRILKNANVLPEWVQVQRDLENDRREIVTLRHRYIRENTQIRPKIANLPPYHKDVQGYLDWHTRSRETVLKRLKDVNTAILKLNMTAPSTVQPPRPYNLEQEMAAFDEQFPALAHTPKPPTETTQEGTLRRIARERYQQGTGGGPVGGWKADSRKNPMDTMGLESEDIGRADVPQE